MQNVRHITQNAGNTTQNDDHTMQNVGLTMHNVGRNTLNVCPGSPPTPILEKTLVSKNDFWDIRNKKSPPKH